MRHLLMMVLAGLCAMSLACTATEPDTPQEMLKAGPVASDTPQDVLKAEAVAADTPQEVLEAELVAYYTAQEALEAEAVASDPDTKPVRYIDLPTLVKYYKLYTVVADERYSGKSLDVITNYVIGASTGSEGIAPYVDIREIPEDPTVRCYFSREQVYVARKLASRVGEKGDSWGLFCRPILRGVVYEIQNRVPEVFEVVGCHSTGDVCSIP